MASALVLKIRYSNSKMKVAGVLVDCSVLIAHKAYNLLAIDGNVKNATILPKSTNVLEVSVNALAKKNLKSQVMTVLPKWIVKT